MGSFVGQGFDQRSAASKMFRIVTHPLFESVICSIIMINTLIMAFETQYATGHHWAISWVISG